MKKSRLISLWLCVVIFYFILGKFGLQFAYVNQSVTTVWFPTGLAIASIFLFGNSMISAIFVGAFLTNITITGLSLPTISLALGDTAEAVIIIFFIKRFSSDSDIFNSIRNIGAFVLATAIGSLMDASIGIEALSLFDKIHRAKEAWVTWFLGDLSGGLLLAPLLILWISKHHSFWQRKNLFYIFLLSLLLFSGGEIVFSGIYPFPYIIIPILIWITLEFSQTTATTAIFALSSLAIYNTLQNHGPFIMRNPNQSLISLQLFVISVVPTILIASAIALKKKYIHNSLFVKQTYFEKMIERNPHAIILINRDGDIIFSNKSVKQVLGYGQTQLIGKNFFSFLHQSDKKIIKNIFTEIKKHVGQARQLEFRCKSAKGSNSWIGSTWMNLLKDPYMQSIMITFQNITRKKQDEEAKSKLAAIIQSSQDAIFIKKLNKVVTSWNKGAEQLYGYTESEVVGKPITYVLPEGYYKRVLEPLISKVKNGEKIENFESFQVRKNGTTFPVTISLIPIKDPQNKIKEICITVRDISHQKELEKKKAELISIAGHEINTPITGLFLYLQSLQRIATLEKNSLPKIYLSKMDKQLKKVHYLIRDLLDLSKTRVGKLSFEYTNFDLVTLTKEVASEFDYVQDGAVIKMHGLKQLFVSGDKNRIAQVITNLITNAIKYNKRTITISVRKTEEGVLFTIKDQGIGIAKSQQKKIFENYYRADNAQQVAGSGIGLYLASQIIKEHNGKLWVKSEKGKGSTFYFTLPFASS